jgi:hypothetical protein
MIVVIYLLIVIARTVQARFRHLQRQRYGIPPTPPNFLQFFFQTFSHEVNG